MSSDLEMLIKDILSPFNDIRKAAEAKFNYYYENMTLEDLDSLLNQLINIKDENIKIFICVIIKKFLSEKINQNNTEKFIQYLSSNKMKFINILLYNETSTKLIKNLLVCLIESLYLLKNNEALFIDNIYDIFSYFSQYYTNKKNSKEIKEITRCLFIFRKFIKFMQKVTVNQKLESAIKSFYSIIIEDYKTNISNIINGNLNKELFLENAIYYLKLFKHSNTLMDDSYSDAILNNTYELNIYILNQLISNNIKNSESQISKYLFV